MRVLAGLAGVAAFFLVTGLAAAPAAVAGMSAASAAADSGPPSTLYVGGSASCSDQGPGTQAVPFCSLQKAADMVSPGQTVKVQGGGPVDFGPVTFTRSGTPSAPISFASVGGYATLKPGSGSKAGIILQGVHDVSISGLAVDPLGAADGIDVNGSSAVALDDLVVGAVGTAYRGTGVAIDGASSDVTLSRSGVYGADNPGVTVQAGARNITVTTNVIATHATAIGIDGVDGADVTSNTVAACAVGISITGGTSAVAENNALLYYGTDSISCPTAGTALSVASDSTATVQADYNAWGWAVGSGSAYSWGGTAYTSVPAFQAATGQGAHDLTPVSQNISSGAMPANSPLIDSADCAAPGELSTDSIDQPRVDDPLIADAGSGTCHADRGAFELQDPLRFAYTITPASLKVAAQQDVTVSIAATAATSPWGEPVTYTADFGDGYTAAITPGGDASHAYASPGHYTITLLAADTGGSTWSWRPQVTVYSAAAPAVTLAASPVVLSGLGALPTIGADEVAFAGSAGADNWELASAVIDFGDGTSAQVAAGSAGLPGVPHVYAKAGTYTATLTATDGVGRQSRASVQATVGDETDFTFNTPFVAYSHTVAPHAVVKLSPAQLGLTFTAGDPAAFVTVTVTSPAKAGYVTVYPAGTARPQTATVAFQAGHSASNIALATAGSGQSVDFYNGSAAPVTLTVHTIGFEEGQGTGESTYAPVPPATVLGPTRIAGQHHVAFPVAGLHGVPQGLQDATGLNVILDITESGGAAAGHFTAGPEKPTFVRMPEPGAYWAKGQQVTGLAVVPVNGRVVLTNASSGAAGFTASVVGYYAYSTTGAVFLPSAPRRLLTVQVGGKHWVKLGVAGKNGVPAAASAGGTTAVAVNLTAAGAAANGTVTAYPDGTARPAVTTLSYSAGAAMAGAAIVAVGPDGAIDLYNAGLRPVTLTVDLTGSYYAYP
jgi:hypothetical protein